MVVRIILYDKLYNFSNEAQKQNLLSRYKKYLHGLIQGFSETQIQIRKVRKIDNRVEVLIDGPEEIFVRNILRSEVGSVHNFEDLKEGNILKGTLVDVGKVGFGLFLDCGIVNPVTDLFIPLFTLREQLAEDTQKSLRDIVNAYDFIDHFPLFVEISKINGEEENIEAKIAPESMKIFSKIMNENIDGLFFSGETKGQFKKALIQQGHLQDIISLERYGFLEHLVLLTEDTNAPGVITEIGKYLPNCKFSVLNPKRMKALKQH
ncbi:MAG: DUF2110 family protein [Promethearchaeota archaeon]|nr:MAG: DUF2110 family protein [Candidatus Lokiarchaeota archaeon]